MTKRQSRHTVSYAVEPQRAKMGWVLCLPHQAQRFAVVQLTIWRQNHQQFRKRRTVASFTGPGAEKAANDELQRLVAHSKPRPLAPGARFPRTGRGVYARSLTGAEYHADWKSGSREDER